MTTPVQPTEPSLLQKIFGSPEELGGYVVVIVMGATGYQLGQALIDRLIPARFRRRHGVTVIQESGSGGVQETR